MFSKIEKAMKYLSKDHLSNIDMLEPLRRGSVDIIYAGDDGVVIYERNSQACMITMQELEKCKSIIDCERYHSFAVHQENISAWIQTKVNFPHCFKAYQAVYEKKQITVDFSDDIRVLTHDYIEQIFNNYDTMSDRNYIETLIDKTQLWGIFDQDALAGFIGEHLEGSMGLLEVLPEYRRRGYGYKLQSYLINHILQRGQVPFCQVVTDNVKSLALQQKLGMNISRDITIWLFV